MHSARQSDAGQRDGPAWQVPASILPGMRGRSVACVVAWARRSSARELAGSADRGIAARIGQTCHCQWRHGRSDVSGPDRPPSGLGVVVGRYYLIRVTSVHPWAGRGRARRRPSPYVQLVHAFALAACYCSASFGKVSGSGYRFCEGSGGSSSDFLNSWLHLTSYGIAPHREMLKPRLSRQPSRPGVMAA